MSEETPVTVKPKRRYVKSKWKIGNTRNDADARVSENIKLALKSRADNEVKKAFVAYKALAIKRSIEDVKDIRDDLYVTIQEQNNVDTHQKLMELTLATASMSRKLLEEMIENERAKNKPNLSVLKWAIEQLNDLTYKSLSETRKANEGQYEMKHGKKKVVINTTPESLDDWLRKKREGK